MHSDVVWVVIVGFRLSMRPYQGRIPNLIYYLAAMGVDGVCVLKGVMV